jgi:hypothetical protein
MTARTQALREKFLFLSSPKKQKNETRRNLYLLSGRKEEETLANWSYKRYKSFQNDYGALYSLRPGAALGREKTRSANYPQTNKLPPIQSIINS